MEPMRGVITAKHAPSQGLRGHASLSHLATPHQSSKFYWKLHNPDDKSVKFQMTVHRLRALDWTDAKAVQSSRTADQAQGGTSGPVREGELLGGNASSRTMRSSTARCLHGVMR